MNYTSSLRHRAEQLTSNPDFISQLAETPGRHSHPDHIWKALLLKVSSTEQMLVAPPLFY